MNSNYIGTIESSQCDYKGALETKKPKSWLKSVSAFANTNGGHIFFGVSDDTHNPIGLDNPQAVVSKISELICSRISPQPRFTIVEFPGKSKDKMCIDLMVDNGPNYPYYYAVDRVKEAYVRHGDRSVIAADYELNNLVLKGEHRTYDSLPSKYKLEEISFTLLNAAFKKETGDSLVAPRDLISMGLVDLNGMVSNAGLLLCDQGLVPQSRIFCTRWKGITKGTVDGDALDDKEYRDESLISLLNDAEAFVRNNSQNPWSIKGFKRVESSDYPFRAVREILVNAIIHRDYQIIGSEVHIDMFDDRMEIVSPGGMLSGKRIQELDLRRIPSMRRNEIIADFFGRLRFMDRRGSGIGRILDEYTELDEQPVFSSDETSFSVILPNRSNFTSHGKSLLNKEEDEKNITITVQEKDWELDYFIDVVMNGIREEFRQKRYNQIIDLFKKYRYSYHFNRRNLADTFEVKEAAASAVIRKCLELGIIEKVQRDEYCFKQNEAK